MLNKPLNPNAPEWSPLPHLFYQPPPATLLPPQYYSWHPHQTHTQRLHRNKGTRREIPPRIRRATTYIHTPKRPPPPPPPPQKQEWVRKSEKARETQSPLYSTNDSFNSTVMIKHIPNKLRRDYMLGFLDECCKTHSLEYDFLYLPMDFRVRNNLGYAFVNFTTANAAKKFMGILKGYKWDRQEITSKKICDIKWARVQGKEAQIRRFQNSNFMCDSPEFLPVVLDPPRNGSDPNPPPPVIVGRLHQRY